MLKNLIQKYQSFIIYLIIGASTTILDALLYWLLVNVFHLWYFWAGAITGVAIPAYNFFSHKRFTFKNKNKTLPQLPRYLTLLIFNYFVGLFLLYVFVDVLNINYMVSKILVTLVFALYNFFAFKLFVFKG